MKEFFEILGRKFRNGEFIKMPVSLGIAKVISAFKGNYTEGDSININIKHNSDDCDEEE